MAYSPAGWVVNKVRGDAISYTYTVGFVYIHLMVAIAMVLKEGTAV